MRPHDLLAKAITVFESLGVPYLVAGSVASTAYGEPRMTLDIDIVAAIEERHVAGRSGVGSGVRSCILMSRPATRSAGPPPTRTA